MTTMHLRVSGPDAAAHAAILAREFEALFGQTITAVPETATADGSGDKGRLGDALGVIAVLMAIPGFLSEIDGLKDRIDLTEKWSQLIAVVDAHIGPGSAIEVIGPDGQPIPLDPHNIPKILDAVTRERKAGAGGAR